MFKTTEDQSTNSEIIQTISLFYHYQQLTNIFIFLTITVRGPS